MKTVIMNMKYDSHCTTDELSQETTEAQPSQDEISVMLIGTFGFRKVSRRTNSNTEFDWNKFDCVIRTGDIHYLYWSSHYKYFSIGVRHERPKGKPAGGVQYWTYTMIPKVIRSVEDAQALVLATCDFDYMKTICQ